MGRGRAAHPEGDGCAPPAGVGAARSVPRFVEHLGRDAPSLEDITGRHRRRPDLPLHAKDVPPLDTAALLRLPCSPARSSALSRALRWLTDEELYRALGKPARVARPPSLSAADIEVMEKLRRYAVIEDCEIFGLANLFSVCEISKGRRRHIVEPLINDLLVGAFDVFSLPGPDDVRAMMRRYGIQFDASSFYDQFELAPGVSRYFAFRVSGGARCYSRLPMGFRPACSIAQATMEVLADVGVEGVTAIVYIDNVLFTGDIKEDVARAGEIFKERCRTAQVTLNAEGDEIVDEFDFLGARYDLGARTARNTSKTQEKLAAALDVLAGPGPLSLRQLAAVFGLLFWCQQVSPLRLAPYFAALAAFRHLPLESRGPARWNAPAPQLSPEALEQLRAWLLAAHALPIRPLVDPVVPGPEFRVWVDASAYGWGALVERVSDGSVRRLGQQWSTTDVETYNVSSSVVAEPLGMRRALLAVCSADTRAVEVHTDHQPLMFAWRSGRGRVAAYNDCVVAVQSAFPQLHVDVQFVRGVDNIHADSLSRGNG